MNMRYPRYIKLRLERSPEALERVESELGVLIARFAEKPREVPVYVS